MLLFQVSSRNAQLATLPRKRSRRFPHQWYIVARVIGSMLTVGLIFTWLTTFGDAVFLLLPIFLSLAMAQPMRYNIGKFLNSTPLYLLLTVCLTTVFYSIVILGDLFIHPGMSDPHIILVATPLAWIIMLEPARIFVQRRIEQRFNYKDREAAKLLNTFTATLREEIDLASLCNRFLTVIQQTMQPTWISLWTSLSEMPQEKSGPEDAVAVADNDALIVYALNHPNALDLENLQLDSPMLQDLRARGAEMLLPLASQGELIGLLILGVHRRGGFYTHEERTMLDALAPQVAPALRVAQLVQEQQLQVRKSERIEQELRTAQVIQQTFLPKELPLCPGWEITRYYQPAREVGGDFYDLLPFEDGYLGVVIGDVTDKGMPAALVMTATRTMLRTAAQERRSPGEVLAKVNDLLYADIPPGMFVTCFYALLELQSGRLRFANAGHDLPYKWLNQSVFELLATGMPLGLMPGSAYEEREVALAPGENLLFYSDGLVEARNARREMLGFPRLKALLQAQVGSTPVIATLLEALRHFTGEGWEQEDDVTLVNLQRMPIDTTSPEQASLQQDTPAVQESLRESA